MRVSGNVSGLNPFEMALGLVPSALTLVDLSSTGGSSTLQPARQFVYEWADEFLDNPEDEVESSEINTQTEAGMSPDRLITEYTITTARGQMNVLDSIALIVAEYMSVNGGSKWRWRAF